MATTAIEPNDNFYENNLHKHRDNHDNEKINNTGMLLGTATAAKDKLFCDGYLVAVVMKKWIRM